MRQTTQLAIAGLGLVGKRHAEAIARVETSQLAAIVDPGADAQALSAKLDVPIYDDLGTLFENQHVDGIILATPNNLHVGQGLECIAQGCPVLVEKPIATSAAAAETLNTAAEARGVPVLVGHHRRHNPIIRQAKSLVDAGVIGDIRAVQATCWLYKPDAYFDAADWRKRPGAGPIAVNLVHDIDLLRHFCGEVVRVQAAATKSQRGYDNEDLASAILEFASGAIGTITVSDSIVAPWSWEMTAAENPVYPLTDQSCCIVGGSAGSLSIPDLRVWTHEGGKQDWWAPLSSERAQVETADPLEQQIVNFVQVIRGHADPVVSGREGQATLKVIEAIALAATTRQAVDIRP